VSPGAHQRRRKMRCLMRRYAAEVNEHTSQDTPDAGLKRQAISIVVEDGWHVAALPDITPRYATSSQRHIVICSTRAAYSAYSREQSDVGASERQHATAAVERNVAAYFDALDVSAPTRLLMLEEIIIPCCRYLR